MDTPPSDKGNDPPNKDTVTKEQFINALKVISEFQKSQLCKTDLKLTDKDFPAGWGSRSRAPFYNSKWAEELRPHLESLYQVPNPREKPEEINFNKDLELFFGSSNFTSNKSGRIKIHNSWLWLINNDDPHKIYRRLRDSCIIKSESGGLAIRWKANIEAARNMVSGRHTLESTPLKASVVDVIQKKSSKWMADLDDFITNATEDNEILKKYR